jgi:hypothetical protein
VSGRGTTQQGGFLEVHLDRLRLPRRELDIFAYRDDFSLIEADRIVPLEGASSTFLTVQAARTHTSKSVLHESSTLMPVRKHIRVDGVQLEGSTPDVAVACLSSARG